MRESRTWAILALGLVMTIPATPTVATEPDATAVGSEAPGGGPLEAMADLAADATRALGSLGGTMTEATGHLLAGGLGRCGKRGGVDVGTDGRLTVLLLGSDYRRRPYIGERMDTIMVVTRKPSGRVAMASIPRDTSWFPRAARNGGGTSGAGRVNAMYYFYKRWSRFGPSAVDCRALDRFRADVAAALRTEIDHYAMVRMRPMVDLVDRIGPIRVDVPGPIVDTSYGRRGLFFPLATDYRLKGNPRCAPKPSRCRSTLAYVRSRSGREGSRYNSDFRRAYRQQDVVLQTARRVRERGTGAALTDLVSGIRGKIYTDIPATLSSALTISGLVGGTTMSPRDRVVFAPSTWAYEDGRTPLYSFRLRLRAVRRWIDRHFGS